MVVFSMRCPKCGLTQMQAPACKRCGAAVGAPQSPHTAPGAARKAEAPLKPPTPPSPQSQPAPTRTSVVLDQTRQLFFHGTGGTLLGIQMVNVLLTIVTLGIYSFWGRVKVRKYLLSETEFEWDRFAYHATGRELLNGSLKAGLVFGLPVGFLNVAPSLLDAGTAVNVVATLLIYCLLMVFVPFAMVGTRRYRLSRTSWRGIRFSFRGKVPEFIKLFIGGSLLTIITFGLYYPIFDIKRYGFMTSHSYFGNQKFAFDGQGRDLLWSYIAAFFLSIVTFGIYWFWFLAKKHRYLMEHTSFATARFRSTVTGGQLLLLNLGNLLLLMVTLGLAFPWVLVRNMRFYFSCSFLEGPLDVAAIQQEAQTTASATGEGLAGFLDLDFDLG